MFKTKVIFILKSNLKNEVKKYEIKRYMKKTKDKAN